MTSTRQLAAILFSDVVGYTALMGQDERRAFDVLRRNRAVQRPIIEAHRGRWIKELGDGVMASFHSAADAVHAAVKIQEACGAEADFQLRIGIHLSDVVFEQDDVFGDGVNLAARIQAASAPGTIYVSEAVRQNIANQPGLQTRFVKQVELKNVREPVSLYEVIQPGVAASESPVKPMSGSSHGIAVLPFANLSSDPEQEYFSDGLTEEIISDLSRIQDLLVISRSSVMTLKGTAKRMHEIAGELNVRYVLEGSVRKAGNQLRITAQLIDAVRDAHLWTEKYSGVIDDVFDIQEKVSRSIADALKLKLSPEVTRQIAERPIPNVLAYESYLKARQEVMRGSPDSMANAFQLIQNALEVVGDNDLLYALLGYAHIFFFRFVDKRDLSHFEKARQFAARSIDMNPDCALGHVTEGWVLWTEGNLQGSCDSMKRALAIEPNQIDALFGLAETYLYAGKAGDTLEIIDKLTGIDPLTPMTWIMKGSYSMDIELAVGLPAFEKAHAMDPQSPLTQWMLASAYFWNGRNADAFPLVDRLSEVAPDWSFTRQLQFLAHGLKGEKRLALAFATPELEAEAENDQHFAFHLAECYAVAGETEKALDHLAFAMKLFFPPTFLAGNILFENIRHEARFTALIADAQERSAAFRI
jgi:TolB-like protein/class 3 adenylate cyclase/thioredoxin-like negative regulator of GroEL